MATLKENRYGKTGVRLMKVTRNRGVHTVAEWTVRVLLEGDFEDVHVTGNNAQVLPTDTMKNTVYAQANLTTADAPETFAAELVDFFLARNTQVTAAAVSVDSHLWKRMNIDGGPHPDCFIHGSNELQTATLRRALGEKPTLTCGLRNLVVLKTANSAFEGYLRDDLTTLKETSDRLLGTSVTANWKYSITPQEPWDLRHRTREAMLAAFAAHDSRSVQQTLYAMAEYALNQVAELTEVHLVMPNMHNILVDLSPFGQTNNNEIFMPISDPSGYIEARVTR